MSQTHGNRRSARWIALAGLSATAWAAHAGDAAPTANGVMTFANVQVESAPVARAAPSTPRAKRGEAGFTAFIDPATGKLTSPTAEQAADLAQAAAAAKPGAAKAQNRLSSVAPQAQPIYPAQGGVGMALDDLQMSYSVARKDGQGKVATDCIPGTELARWSSKKAKHTAKHTSTGEEK
jgi:hypothetical protein